MATKTLTTPHFDAGYEVNWLKRWPEFQERPATILEFLDVGYLDVASRIRNSIKECLVDLFGEEVAGDHMAAYTRGILTGAIGIGKQLKIGTPILTPKGWVPIESLAVGNNVIGSNGHSTRVTGVYPQGRKPLFRVKFIDGSWVDAGADHQWVVHTRHYQYNKNLQYKVMTTAQIAARGLRSGDGWKWRIPLVEPVEFEPGEPLPIPAYTFGALLGDGCFTKGTITLAGDDLTIGERVQCEMPDLFVRRAKDGRQWTISRGRNGGGLDGNRLMTAIRQLGLAGLYSHEKFIPECFMRASPADRLDLIRGLMDTDGSLIGRNGAVFANGSRQLCEQVMELVQSLGGTARMTWFDRGGDRSLEYQVKINLGAVCPFWISRKVAKWQPRTNQVPTRAIVSIEPVEDDEAFCIAVDAPDHLYVTKDFIVTHNTTIASVILSYLAHYVLCIKDPQDYFNLLPGSRIAFMQMSTSETQAKEVVFGDIKARIKHAQWFVQNYQFDPIFKNQLRFAKDIWILPGDSHETTFEGYNILGGILDEADSHMVTPTKDYAEIGYDCADAETEILTAEGWKSHQALTVGDDVLTLNHETGLAEWQRTEEVRRFQVVDEELVLMEGKEFSSLTTHNHRWPVITNAGSRLWKTTDTLALGNGVVVSAPCADLPVEPKYSDAFVELVAWFWTEGNIKVPGQRQIAIYQGVRSPYVERIRAALHGVFGPSSKRFPRRGSAPTDGVPRWREVVNRHLVEFHLCVDAGERLLAHAPGRVVSFGFLRSLTQAQLDLFIQASLWADNCGDRKLAQKDPAAAEAFAFACTLAGHGVSIRPKTENYLGYRMTLVRMLRKRRITPMDAAHKRSNFKIEKVRYTGTVWCPKTANKSWFARRKGSCYFTGNTIANRVDSRFGDKGFLLVIGQMKSGDGFAHRKFEEFSARDDTYAKRMTIWESFGEDHYRCKVEGPHEERPDLVVGEVCNEVHKFPYDTKRKNVITPALAQVMGSSESIIWIPNLYKREFDVSPEKALKDLAGYPPAVGDPFISLPHKIEEAVERWIARYGPDSPVSPEGILDKFYRAPDSLPRVGHIDIAYSADGDALGFAMGHVHGVADVEGENKPYIVIDLCYRVKAPAGSEVFLKYVRQFIYGLKEDRKFKLKFVSLDGFQGVDTRQQLTARRIPSDVQSVDKDLVPYYDLRDALYEDRIELPPYMVYLQPGATETTPILMKEMSELIDAGKKIDHPSLRGSKDVSDAVAAVVFKLMGDRSFRRKVVSFESRRQEREDQQVAVGGSYGMQHPAYVGASGFHAPLPPTTPWRPR